MLRKRGQIILIVALEIVAAVFASVLLFNIALGWASGDAASKLYFAKDLALLTDTLFIAPDVTVFYYKENVSGYDVNFMSDAVGVSKFFLDPTSAVHHFVPFRNSSIDNIVRRPKVLVLTRAGPNLSVGLFEDSRLTAFPSFFADWLSFDDIKINDSKRLVVSQLSDNVTGFVEKKFFPGLKRGLRGFDITYSSSIKESAEGVLIVFDKADDPLAINIFYPVVSDSVVNSKARKLGILCYKGVDFSRFHVSLNPSNSLGFERLGLVVALGDKVLGDEDVVVDLFYGCLNNFFGENSE